MTDLLKNYHALVGKVDSLCQGITLACGEAISCRKGCDGCCRRFSVSWVEAVNIAFAVQGLDRPRAEMIRARVRALPGGDDCPLLEGGSCLLYDHRPIICRTHGLPILIRSKDSTVIDFCPRNFQNADAIEGQHVIDLDLLNETLAAVNSLLLKDYFKGETPPADRLTIAEALLLRI